jgi:AGZA family xanthine/uracil permease-like MFS transporter
MILMERGFIFTCMFWAAISVCLIDREFYKAAVWSLIAAAFTGIGLMHAYQITDNTVDFLFCISSPNEAALAFRAQGIALGYLLFAAVFAGFGLYNGQTEDQPLTPAH